MAWDLLGEGEEGGEDKMVQVVRKLPGLLEWEGRQHRNSCACVDLQDNSAVEAVHQEHRPAEEVDEVQNSSVRVVAAALDEHSQDEALRCCPSIELAGEQYAHHRDPSLWQGPGLDTDYGTRLEEDHGKAEGGEGVLVSEGGLELVRAEVVESLAWMGMALVHDDDGHRGEEDVGPVYGGVKERPGQEAVVVDEGEGEDEDENGDEVRSCEEGNGVDIDPAAWAVVRQRVTGSGWDGVKTQYQVAHQDPRTQNCSSRDGGAYCSGCQAGPGPCWELYVYGSRSTAYIHTQGVNICCCRGRIYERQVDRLKRGQPRKIRSAGQGMTIAAVFERVSLGWPRGCMGQVG